MNTELTGVNSYCTNQIKRLSKAKCRDAFSHINWMNYSQGLIK